MSVLRQALHVLAKDLRRFRAELLVVYALLAVAVATLDPGTGTSTILSGLLLPVGVLLVTAMVVHEDGPGDERAFWLTRPLDPVGVLLGKALFVGVLLVAVPVAAHVAAVAAVPASDPPGRILLGALVVFGGLVAVAAGLASVTRSLQSFVVAGLGVGVAFVLGRRLLFSGVVLERGEGTTAMFLLSAGWLVLGGAAVAHQYVSRRTRRTVVLAAVAAAAVLVAVPRLGLNLSRPASPEPEQVEIPAEGLTFAMEGLSLEPVVEGPLLHGSDDNRLVGSWILTGEEWLHAEPREVAAVARGPGLERRWSGPAATIRFPSTWNVRLPGLVGVDPGGGPDEMQPVRGRGRATLLVAPPAEMRRLADRISRLEVTIGFDAYRWTVRETLPLREGATLRAADGRYSVETVVRRGGVTIVIIEHRAVFSALTEFPDAGLEEPGVILVNRERKEYLLGRSGGGSSSELGSLLGGIRTRGESRRFTFGYPPRAPGQGPTPDEAWLRGAELALVGREYVGSFSKTWSAPVEMPRVFDRYVSVPPPAAPDPARPESPAPRRP